MESIRGPFQGVYNILRFNRHFYLLAAGAILILCLFKSSTAGLYFFADSIAIILLSASVLTSLLVSFYTYDLSGFYNLNWLNDFIVPLNSKMVNINAGFDETSALLLQKYPGITLLVYDFYDPIKHTEVSIKRARKAYLPFQGTLRISARALPLPENYADSILLIFSAHEIRSPIERNAFFCELSRILKPDGKIVLVEHLRNLSNFLAYNIGFFHFISGTSWYDTFKAAGLIVSAEKKITPFITKFILVNNGRES